MHKNQTAYLTIISWPAQFDESHKINALVRFAAMDPFQAKLASRRNLPGVMAPIESAMRGHIVNAMHGAGILCIAPTHDEIESYPQAQTAIGVQQFPDADPARFVVEIHNGEHWTFGPDQVKLIVSGHIRSTTTTVDVDHNAPDSGGMNTEVRISRNTKVMDLIDLHIRVDDQLELVRLIGHRTRIGIVGDTARRSLLDDSRPIEIAQILMPDSPIDTEFQGFDPPGNIRRLSQKKSGKSGSLTMESWAFYSPWVGLIKQSMYDWA